MNLNDFINFRKNCIACGNKNILMMYGNITENIDSSCQVHSMVNYILPVVRKNFITFAAANIAMFSTDDLLDIDTFHKEKYDSFTINKDGYVVFDYDFNFKIKMHMKMICPDNHYMYNSRSIIVSNKSPDITKGYPVVSESFSYKNYKVVVSLSEKTTSIFNFESSKKPVVVPYMDMASFPCAEPEKFVKKVQNILLLA